MKKKHLTVAIATALLLSVCLTACGDDSDSSSSSDTETTTETTDTANDDTDTTDTTTNSDFSMDGAEVKEWGDYTVSVPSGWEFKEGDTLDETDTRYCSVKKSDLSYFDFKIDEDENSIMNAYNYNKDTYTNEQSDVSGTYGDIAWTGFQYGDGFGGYGFEAYASVSGKFVRVSATFAFDSPEAVGILESLSIK